MIKLYINKKKTTYDMADYVGDERIKRDLIHKLIENIPLDQLGNVFHINVLDPRTEESKKKIAEKHIDKECLLMNQHEGTVEYEVSIKIKQK